MKPWIKRAVRTFFQTACGVISTEIMVVVAGVSDMKALKAALIALGASAISAGIAAVMNLNEGE